MNKIPFSTQLYSTGNYAVQQADGKPVLNLERHSNDNFYEWLKGDVEGESRTWTVFGKYGYDEEPHNYDLYLIPKTKNTLEV